MDITEALENLVTEIVDNDGVSYEYAIGSVKTELGRLYSPYQEPVRKGVNRQMHDGTVWAAMPEYGVYVRFHIETSNSAWLLSMPMLKNNEPDSRYYPGDVVQVDKDEVAATTPTFYAEALAMLGVE